MRVTLPARRRGPMSKGDLGRTRREGLVPITVSTPGEESRQLLVPARELTDALHRYGPSALIQLGGEGGNALVIARNIERAPVTGSLLHVGFKRVSEREPVTAEVAVRLVGEPDAVQANTAVLEQQLTAVQVRALPDRLPTHIDCDVSALDLGGVLRAGDIPSSPEYEIVTDPDSVVATVHTVRAAVTPEEEAQVSEEEAGEQAAQAEVA